MIKLNFAIKINSAFLIVLLSMAAPISAIAGDSIYTGLFSNTAVGGYDAVSFFTSDGPVKGKSAISVEYMGALWLFANRENRDLFAGDPKKYAPQYGGFCAWAVAEKKSRAPGNPKYWRVVSGKLYLNYSKSVQEQWLRDIPGHIARADQNWPALLND